MLKTAARFLLLRFLPRRILPIVTVVEALLFVSFDPEPVAGEGQPADESRTAPPEPLLVRAAPTGPARTDSPASRRPSPGRPRDLVLRSAP